MPKNEHQIQDGFSGTREFKQRYAAGFSTQSIWRSRGMPYYRVPNSKKILYRFSEIDAWLASGKVTFKSASIDV